MNICDIQKMVDNDGIVFVSYGGFLSQTLISAMTEALEKETEMNDINIGISNNIFTVFIELSQNMMNYSKNTEEGSRNIFPGGLIVVARNADGSNYYLHSQNIISLEDKEKIEPKLQEIKTLSRDGIKQRYKELRRLGSGIHEKGAGIGFYEIAKRCKTIEYDFQMINNDKYFFHIKTTIAAQKGE